MQSHFVQVDDLRLHYLEAGTGPAVLFLHGWPTSGQLWRHVLPAVAPHRRAIALDLPGFGLSDKPPDASYSFRYFDRVINGFLDALGVQETGLVIHDLGGPAGLHWAASDPSRVTELGVLNTLVYSDLSWAIYVFLVAARMPGLSHIMRSQWAVRKTMRFGVRDTSMITDEIAEMYAAPYTDADSRLALKKAAHGLHPGGFKTIEAMLPKLSVPTRLLWGEKDRILPDMAKTMRRLKAQWPHAELSSIPNCGHFLQEERPDEVAALLGAFFGRP